MEVRHLTKSSGWRLGGRCSMTAFDSYILESYVD